MKKLIISILIIYPSLIGFSQAANRESDTIFLDINWIETQNKVEAIYFRKTKLNIDSILEVRDFYISTGKLQMQGYYKHEMKIPNKTGHFEFYFEDGTKSGDYFYEYGLLQGECRKYYENGNLKSVYRYDLGARIDTSWEYYPSGQLHTIEVENKAYIDKNPSDKYKKRKLLLAYNEKGELQVKEGNGLKKDYFLSGKIKSIISYQNGFPHGKWIKYTGRKKKKQSVLHFKDGRFIKGEIYRKGKNDIFSSLSRGAYYASGFSDLKKFIKVNTGFCEEGFKNEVEVMIHISVAGKVMFEQILSGNVTPCQLEEIQQMIKNMPNWTPAVHEGEYVEGSETFVIKY